VQVAGYPILGLLGGIAVLPLAAAALRWRPSRPPPSEPSTAAEAPGAARIPAGGAG
jgi:hypothetical protein